MSTKLWIHWSISRGVSMLSQIGEKTFAATMA